MNKGTIRAHVWIDSGETTVCLRLGGASFVYVNCYDGPKITDGNFQSEEVWRAVQAAKVKAREVAKTMLNMSLDDALDYYRSL